MNKYKSFSRFPQLKRWGLLVLLGLAWVSASQAEEFKFGVMSDTQWTYANNAENPESVAVSIIKQLNPKFIEEGVEFVIQVGDITDDGHDAAIETHAAARQDLYDAGIGFFPLRGNHESGMNAALQLPISFPQTLGQGPNVFGATNFSSADPDRNGNLEGLSYKFQYGNATFVMLDQFTRKDGASGTILDQLDWIDSVVSSRPADSHAFVFAHKNLMGANHTDTLFGSNPASEPAAQNAFVGSMNSNAVGYVMGGHDHVHQRSLITSPNGLFETRQIILASDSSKFYTPKKPSNDEQYNNPTREVSIAQDLYRLGYYIFTINGPNVTVEYYASDEYFPAGNSPSVTPELHFTLRETFGYSLNGKEFLIEQGQDYTLVQDSIAAGSGFAGTTAEILDGTNNSTVKDGSNRSLIKCVSTGWAPKSAAEYSDVLHLMGMPHVAEASTDTFVLEMSFDSTGLTTEQLESGEFALCTKNAYGRWVRAVDMNVGGTSAFVNGPWNSSYELGTYGVDTTAGTVWAVINHNSEFAAAMTHIPAPGYIAGDFHQHSVHTDGSFPMQTVFSNSARFGLDWWANSEHGGIRDGVPRWQDVGGFGHSPNDAYSSWEEVIMGRDLHPTKTIIQGLELNVPGHEHASTAIIAEQYPEGTNLYPLAQFEYLFDAGDSDTSGGPDGTWTNKNTVNDHAKTVEAITWMQENYSQQSWFIPAHPERKGMQNYPNNGVSGSGYSAGAFRDMNNAGPDVCFGFESIPGHQRSSSRGGYSTSALGGTYGGAGFYSAKVGGLWDSLLGEGRAWWLFASSDFHSTGGDYWPGEYQKNYNYVDDAYVVDSEEAAQAIVDSLRSGNSWTVMGDLIDSLDFTVNDAVMGSTLFVNSNEVTVSIMVHDPAGTNFSPTAYNMPELDHIDVIAGEFGDVIATNDPNYNSSSNETTRVVARFDATGGEVDGGGLTSTAWTDLGDGWKEMTITFDTEGKSTYFRLRGSNLGLDVANETDAEGNPLADSLLGTNDDEKTWSDLWFYSNPVFIQVNQAPSVSITSPTNGTDITEGYTVQMVADASDDSEIVGVDFYADGSYLGTDDYAPFVYNWADASEGDYDLMAVALDEYGLTATSAVVSISVVAPDNSYDSVSNVIRSASASVSDTVEEDAATGEMDFGSSDLEICTESAAQIIGVRFPSVTIPKGTKILDAYIQFTCDETKESKNVDPFNVTIHGEAADAAASFSTNAYNVSSRSQTTASATWSDAPKWLIEHEAGPAQRTPNLKAIVQEVVDREGWAEGGPIAFMLQGEGTRCAESYDGGGDEYAPKLVVIAVTESTYSVLENSDDVEEVVADGSMDHGSSDLEIVQESSTQAIGIRFAGVVIPDGAELVNAYIQFTQDETKTTDPFNVTIQAEASANPVTYGTAAYSVSSRNYTTSSVAWSGAPAWTVTHEAGPAQRTPNLKDLILEVMENGWESGNAMAFMLTGEGCRCAESRDGGGEAYCPKLVLQYAGAGPQAPEMEWEAVDGRINMSWPTAGFDGYELQFKCSLMDTNWIAIRESGFFRLIKIEK